MNKIFKFVMLSSVFGVIYTQSCKTPLGAESQCVTLCKCPKLLIASIQRPLQNKMVTFLRKSQCGFVGVVPKVCCGPLPEESGETMSQPSIYSFSPLDPVSQVDSHPSPFGECGMDTIGDRIIGGQTMELEEFPWMVLLGYMKTDGVIIYACNGALINNRYVLTAAHCVADSVDTKVGSLVTARLGEYDTRREIDCVNGVCADPVQEIPVHRAYPHPDYAESNKNKKNDIAVIRLTRRANFTKYVKPICLPKPETRVWPGYEVFVAGWGKTLFYDSSVKRKVSLPIFNKADCVKKYLELGARLTKRQICAGGVANRDSCKGDSGGPLMMRTTEGWMSVGVVSIGFGCGKPDWPGVYTSVPSYIAWIQSVLISSNQDGQ